MIPSALLRKMPAQERDYGAAEAGKTCIHLLCVTVLSKSVLACANPGVWVGSKDLG
jgi:hypothetical protein